MIEITLTNHTEGLQATIHTKTWKLVCEKPRPFTLTRKILAEIVYSDGTKGGWHWRTISEGYYETEEKAIAAGRKYVGGDK